MHHYRLDQITSQDVNPLEEKHMRKLKPKTLQMLLRETSILEFPIAIPIIEVDVLKIVKH